VNRIVAKARNAPTADWQEAFIFTRSEIEDCLELHAFSDCRGASGMPRGVKGLLVAITSVIYLFVLTAFFIAQQAVRVVGKLTGSVVDWSPGKPRAFGMRL
jgi:hypothetical protein